MNINGIEAATQEQQSTPGGLEPQKDKTSELELDDRTSSKRLVFIFICCWVPCCWMTITVEVMKYYRKSHSFSMSGPSKTQKDQKSQHFFYFRMSDSANPTHEMCVSIRVQVLRSAKHTQISPKLMGVTGVPSNGNTKGISTRKDCRLRTLSRSDSISKFFITILLLSSTQTFPVLLSPLLGTSAP